MKPLLLTLALGLLASLVVNSLQEDPFLPGVAEKVRAISDRITAQKADNLAYDYAAHYSSDSHQAKLNYRFVPPLIMRAVGPAGLRAFEFLSYLTLGACIFIALARVSPARVAACGALAVLCTSSGAVWWNDLGHTDDVVAQAFLALNLVWLSPWLMGVSVVLALFTDERAVLILPVLVGLVGWRRSWPYLAGVVVYATARLSLGAWLYAPVSYADIACWDYALAGVRLLPAVIWGMYEGAWLMLLGAALWIWRRNRWLALAVVLYPLAVAALSLSVLDMTRSASYGILAPVVAVLLARMPARRLAWLCLAGSVMSVACPNSLFITGFIEMFK